MLQPNFIITLFFNPFSLPKSYYYSIMHGPNIWTYQVCKIKFVKTFTVNKNTTKMTSFFSFLRFFLYFSVLQHATANTETLMLSFPLKNVTNISVPDAEFELSPGKISVFLTSSYLNNPELAQFYRSFTYNYTFVKIKGFVPGKLYNLRACWPATYPVSLDLETTTDSTGEQYMVVKHYPKFFSIDDEKLLQDLSFPVNFHMVETTGGVPNDVIGIVTLIVVVLSMSIPASSMVLNYFKKIKL